MIDKHYKANQKNNYPVQQNSKNIMMKLLYHQ